MVQPDPTLGSKFEAVFDDGKAKKVDAEPVAADAPAASRSLLKISLSVVVVAILAVWLRPRWLPPPQEPVAASNPFQNVFDWVGENGADIGSIQVIGFDGYYELVALDNVDEGDRLLSVPMSQILDENLILADETVQSVLEQTDSLDENGAAVVFLLANQDKWGVYLDMIQELDVASPLFWTEDELAQLQGSMINHMMDELRAVLTEQFAAIEMFFTGLTFDEYTRLWVNINSRMWQLQKSETESVSALMPVFDFAAHSTEANVEIGYDPETDAVVMSATTSIQPMESLHNFYFNTSNIHHLMFQGFTIDENDDHLACDFNVGESRCSVESNPSISASESLVKCAKELEKDEASTVWTKLAQSAKASLDAFPNSLAEDDALLQTELNAILHNAVQARRGEKMCLNQARKFAEYMMEALSTNSWDAVDVAVAESPETSDYVQSVKARTEL